MKNFTKIWIYSLVILGVFILLSSSCKKKDDNTNPTPVTVSNTTWDVTIVYDSSTTWHADVTFNADGTTKYDEPSDPGAFLSYGTWKLTGDKIHFGIGMDPNMVFDGTITGNAMSGSFVSGGKTRTWSAIKRT